MLITPIIQATKQLIKALYVLKPGKRNCCKRSKFFTLKIGTRILETGINIHCSEKHTKTPQTYFMSNIIPVIKMYII